MKQFTTYIIFVLALCWIAAAGRGAVRHSARWLQRLLRSYIRRNWTRRIMERDFSYRSSLFPSRAHTPPLPLLCEIELEDRLILFFFPAQQHAKARAL